MDIVTVTVVVWRLFFHKNNLSDVRPLMSLCRIGKHDQTNLNVTLQAIDSIVLESQVINKNKALVIFYFIKALFIIFCFC